MLKRCAGIHIPVFSLRSKKGLGTGEFLDLIPLIDWCKEAGLKLIKLFPVHDTSLTDTERDASPFSVLSAFSLHPNYLNIRTLAPEFEEEIKPISKVLNQPHLEYRRTYLAKNELLRLLFILRKEEDLSSKGFQQFFKKNEDHLKSYAAFLFLKEKYGTADFHKWGRYSQYTEEIVEEICDNHPEKVNFHFFVQFHLHQQLKEVVDYAEEQGIALIVDFPLTTHPHSVEAWRKVSEAAQLKWIQQYFETLQQLPVVCERKGGEGIFQDPRNFPEMSICTPSLYKMLPLRSWWEEDVEKTALYYNTILKHELAPPAVLTEKLAREIIQGYLDSKSKIALFQMQDLIAMNDDLKAPHPERDLVHWRSHIYIEEFLLVKSFAKEIREMVKEAKR